ncbi:MAG: glycosyltransferase [Frankiaceae bacterium]
MTGASPLGRGRLAKLLGPAEPAPGHPGRQRIAVATADTLKPRMAGPAIRAWQVAAALAPEHDVQLVTTSECTLNSPDFAVRQLSTEPDVRDLERWCDVLFFQGNVFDDYPFLQGTAKVVIVDLYDPFQLEQLEQTREHDPETRRQIVHNATAAANRQCLRGDFFLCASEKQRDFWLGHLTALGRVNTVTYDSDTTLRSLIEVVPFGISHESPRRTRRALKGVVPGIDDDDKVLLWGGGIYNWFDPLTLIRAVDVICRRRTDVRLFFLGMQHPHPQVPEMRMSFAARRLADELGLTGRHVFFNEQWVDYDDRVNYLLDADIGVSTHLDHVETTYSFRTRMLDYLWVGVPMVCTRGDVFADLVTETGLGLTVDAGDVDGLAVALTRLLDDETFAKLCRERELELAPDYAWSRVLRPLIDYCRAPQRAPDLLDGYSRRRMARGAARSYLPQSGWRRDLELVAEHWQDGGARRLTRRAVSRVGYLTGLKKPPA